VKTTLTINELLSVAEVESFGQADECAWNMHIYEEV
jgi:hypothetical protein